MRDAKQGAGSRERRTSQQRRRVAHYVPKPQYRSDDASAHAASLVQALQLWVSAAQAGEKWARLTMPHSKLIARDADTIHCDVAAALAAALEWDGAILAHHLAHRGWPVDVELVRTCHQWSCGLMDRIMAERRARGPRF